jgi:branched-chain amino acid transport system substrate-binding protein
VIGFDTQSGRTFLDLSKELLATTPDGILIIANSMDAALICQQIRKLDAGMLSAAISIVHDHAFVPLQ